MTSMTANRGVKTIVSTGAMFSMTRCFRLDQPGGHDHGSRRSHREYPFHDRFGVDAGGGEDGDGDPHQHTSSEREQSEVDEPLAREPHEIHPAFMGPQGPAHV